MPGSLKRCVLVEAKARGERQIFLLERCILTTDANLKKPSRQGGRSGERDPWYVKLAKVQAH